MKKTNNFKQIGRYTKKRTEGYGPFQDDQEIELEGETTYKQDTEQDSESNNITMNELVKAIRKFKKWKST